MAKNFSNTRCVYCLEYFEELTSDHVLPKAWYPDDTPDNLEKWQVPSCYECNQEHGKNEEELLLKLGLHFDPQEGDYQNVAGKVSRSMNPKHGKSKRDRRKRLNQRNRVKNEVYRGSKINFSKSNVLSGFGFRPDFPPSAQPPILIPEKKIKKFCEKVTRGIYYLFNDIYIEKDYDIATYVPSEIPQQIHDMLRQDGKEYNCGNGIQVIMANCIDEKHSALLEITIWDRLRLCSAVIHQKYCEE